MGTGALRKLTIMQTCLFSLVYLCVLVLPVRTGFLENLYRLIFPEPIEQPPVTVPSDCGRLISERIVGGRETPHYAWPWMVSLQNYNERHFCGGVLVSRRHVLTAAHCLNIFAYFPVLLKVLIGSGKLGIGDVHYVDSVHIHPRFGQRSSYDSDLAIIVLSSDVKLNEGVNAACLPSYDWTIPLLDKFGVVLGWGYLNETGKIVQHLREVVVKNLPDEACEVYENLYTNDVMFCAGWEDGQKDACKGDSGGPLLSRNGDGSWELHGIVSFGKGCAKENFPGVYTKIIHFKEWIINTIS